MKPLLLLKNLFHALIGFFESIRGLDDRESAKSLVHRPLGRFKTILPNREFGNVKRTNRRHGDAIDWEDVVGHSQKAIMNFFLMGFENAFPLDPQMITEIDNEMPNEDAGETGKEPANPKKEGCRSINCFGLLFIIKTPTLLCRINIAMLVLRKGFDRRKRDVRLVRDEAKIFLSHCSALYHVKFFLTIAHSRGRRKNRVSSRQAKKTSSR